MMSILIEGPKQSGNDIDVYFQLLVDDLQTLWNTGVEVCEVQSNLAYVAPSMCFLGFGD